MEPVTIVVICATAFGVVTAISAFIRQLLLNREKNLNDKAQQIALANEAKELENLRNEMVTRRFESHYQVLGENKEAIQYIDQKIDTLLKKKSDLIQRYSDIILKESSGIIEGTKTSKNKDLCNRLKEEIEIEVKSYETEIASLQKRRFLLWDSHTELQDYILDEETRHSRRLDELFKHHSAVLEKIYLRYNDISEKLSVKTIDAGSEIFKLLLAPFYLLIQYFKKSTKMSSSQLNNEVSERRLVAEIEDEINSLNQNRLDTIPEDNQLSI